MSSCRAHVEPHSGEDRVTPRTRAAGAWLGATLTAQLQDVLDDRVRPGAVVADDVREAPVVRVEVLRLGQELARGDDSHHRHRRTAVGRRPAHDLDRIGCVAFEREAADAAQIGQFRGSPMSQP